MNDDNARQVARSEETVVSGTPDTTVSQTETNTASAQPYVAAAPAARQTVVRSGAPAANQSTVQQTTTTAPSDQVVSHNVSERYVDPAAERAAVVGWINKLIWTIIGIMEVLLALRFVLLFAGANPQAGFAQLIYGLTNWMVAPFAGLFGVPITWDGTVVAGRFAPEVLVAMIVYLLVGFLITKIAELLLGTNRTTGTVVSDTQRRTRL